MRCISSEVILTLMSGSIPNSRCCIFASYIGLAEKRTDQPLGSSEDIRSIDRNTLIEFYQQWYSPQMATVVVVGDVDPVSIEKKIKEMFASIPRKKVKGYRVYPLT